MNIIQISWILSTVSNIIFLFVFIPQFLENYRTKSSDAISIYLIISWVIGNGLIILTSAFIDLNMIVLFVAIYQLTLDLLFLAQLVYYRIYALKQNEQDYLFIQDKLYNIIKDVIFTFIYLVIISILILALTISNIDNNYIAQILGWVATGVFICARLPQIFLNYQRKSVEGLSLMTFFFVCFANGLFLGSIFIQLIGKTHDEQWNYLLINSPWIASNSITSLFDIVIFIQFFIYKQNPIEII